MPDVAKAGGLSQASSAGVREAVIAATLTGLYVVAALAAYFLLPPVDLVVTEIWQAILLAAAALVILVALYLMSLRRIGRAEYPLLRALLIIIVFFVTFVLVVAYIYLSLETRSPGQVPGIATHVDALYFTVTIITTVGFGDITPTGQVARVVATVQMVFTLVFVGALVRSAVNVGRDERNRRQRGQAETSRG